MLTNTKKTIAFFTVILGLIIMINSTVAWRDVSQHKTNQFTTTSVQHNIVLVEEFEPITNWRVNETIKKIVFVRNGQDGDDVEKYEYDDAYVRIQFKEFMEITTNQYIYSDVRLMVNANGTFIRFDQEAEALNYLEDHNINDPNRIIELQGYYDSHSFYYLISEGKDSNGQHGRFLVLDIVEGVAESVISGQVNHNYASLTQHNITPNDEDMYITHTWSDSNVENSYADINSPFNEYVRWTIDVNAIPIESWDGQPVSKWIIDTNSPQGWVYWGEPLVHGNDLELVPESATTAFLESVSLTTNITGFANYYIHVNLDAVSYEDLMLWKDAPEKIMNGYNTNKYEDERKLALKELVNDLEEDIQDKEVIDQNLLDQMEHALKVINKPDATAEDINTSYRALLSSYESTNRD